MTHLRRIAMPKSFPLKRKGREKYVIAQIGNAKTIPLLIVLRDILKIAKTRREARALLKAGEILVNNRKTDDERISVHLFDSVTITRLQKFFRVILKNNKFSLGEISEKESFTRICKIVSKKILSGGKVQINLDNGYNLPSDLKAAVNDSVIFDFKANKIIKHLPLKEKASVEVIGGSHIGTKGILNKMEGRTAEIKADNSVIKIPLANVLVVENEK
jgi:small subunit ribosomal protein S4e